MISPYLASLEWWRSRISAELGRGSIREVRPRDMIRCEIPGNDGTMQLLSIPVTGGSTTVKHKALAAWLTSDHGRWRACHFGALEARYGRYPYFQHYFEDIKEIIAGESKVSELLEALDAYILKRLHFRDLKESIECYEKKHPGLIAAKCREMEKGIDPTTSIVEVLFKYGPASIFLMLGSHTVKEDKADQGAQ